MCNSEDQDTSLNDSTGVDIDSDLDSSDSEHVSPDSEHVSSNLEHVFSDSEHVSPDSEQVSSDSEHESPDSEQVSPDSEQMSPDSSMVFTQCVPQIQVIKHCDNKNEKSNEDTEISTRSIETQCNLLKRSVSTRDAAVQTNNEIYALHCQKKTAIYVGKVTESVDNVYPNNESRKSIRLGLSKKWKLEYKWNK
ncbi:hypothetical protein CBL_11969 [Carabus blaptoides fortunei]